MSYKNLLLNTKLSDDEILNIFLPFFSNKKDFDDRKDNDITLFFLIDTQKNMSKECLLKIINSMIENKRISKKTIEYIVNKYQYYNFIMSDFFKLD